MSKVEKRGWTKRPHAVKYLYYFKCRFCATWAVTAEDAGKYVRCNGCGGSKKYEYRVPVESAHDEESWVWAKANGVGHLPRPGQPIPIRCVRCGELKTTTVNRSDGNVCPECYQAKPLPAELLTPEQQAENAVARHQAQLDDDARMEAAYAAVERER